MTERDEMIERAKKATRNGTLPDHTSIFEDFADFTIAEVARERERIATDLDQILDDPSFEIVDHPGYETLREYAERLRSPKV